MSNLAPYEGRIVEPDESDELRRRIARLETQLEDARGEAHRAKEQSRIALRAVQNIQRRLKPWYEDLRGLFGELDASEITVNSESASASGLSPRWQQLKQKLGGRQAEFIDLLQHGPLTASQIRAAARCDIRTVYSTTHTMRKAGLIEKHGGQFSLKEL